MSPIKEKPSEPTRMDPRWRTNLIVGAICLGFLTFGGFIVLWATGWTDWSAVGVAFGSGIIAVATLSLVVEVWIRRRLTDEVLAAVDVSDEIGLADITRVLKGTSDFRDNFSSAIQKASDVDIMFISASTWIDSHRKALVHMLAKKGRLRILIPSANDQPLLEQLITRFEYTTIDKLEGDIGTTFEWANELRIKFPPKTQVAPFPTTDAAEEQEVETSDGKRHVLLQGVSIRRLSVVPTYSLYRMDDMAVMRVHEVRKERADESPVLVFGNRGTLWRFSTTDFNTLFNAAEEYPM